MAELDRSREGATRDAATVESRTRRTRPPGNDAPPRGRGSRRKEGVPLCSFQGSMGSPLVAVPCPRIFVT